MLKTFIESFLERKSRKISSEPSSLAFVLTSQDTLGIFTERCSKTGNLTNCWSKNSPALSVAQNPLQHLDSSG